MASVKQMERNYKHWDKVVSRCEKNRFNWSQTYDKQIERTYNMGGLTEEQYKDLTERMLAVKKKLVEAVISKYK